MERKFAFLLAVLMSFSLAVCAAEAGIPADSPEGGGILSAYFSWAENAVLADDMDAVASPSAIPPHISENGFDCCEEEADHSEEAVRARAGDLGYSRLADGAQTSEQRQMAVQFGGETVIFALNDGSAADALYALLPLTVEIEDFGGNEKIFYPEQQLDTSGAPLAQGGSGTLAYYEPWGDVVFFYGDFSENPALFALGRAVSGGERIGEMAGTVTLEAVE